MSTSKRSWVRPKMAHQIQVGTQLVGQFRMPGQQLGLGLRPASCPVLQVLVQHPTDPPRRACSPDPDGAVRCCLEPDLHPKREDTSMTTETVEIGTPKTVRAPRGTQRTCKTWQAEAAMRMLMNNLDPEVAELPEQLIIYGGSGRAARSWPDFDRIVAALKELEPDETLLVQSGRAVGVARTHADAPRVLIANSLLVPKWATWDEFRRLEGDGPDHVRPDDRRKLDIHRHAGHPPGHLRDLRSRRSPKSTSAAPSRASWWSPADSAAWAGPSRSR